MRNSQLTLWLVCVAVLLVVRTHSRSILVDVEEQSRGFESGALHRLKKFISNFGKHFTNTYPKSELVTRVKRSQIVNLVLNRCELNSDCVGPQYGTGVPSDLVYCNTESGICVCQQCFVRLNNSCEVISPLCRNYSVAETQCVDHRKSQKTAFLLSFFLSSVGAANFYIGDYILAGIQLGLFLLTLLVLLITLCVPICIFFCCDDDYEFQDEMECCTMTIMFTGILLIIFIFLVMSCWWVADLAIFVYNGRADLNQCSLANDL